MSYISSYKLNIFEIIVVNISWLLPHGLPDFFLRKNPQCQGVANSSYKWLLHDRGRNKNTKDHLSSSRIGTIELICQLQLVDGRFRKTETKEEQ